MILQLADQAIDNDAPLNELGIDSLVAVEVRSWFLKELKVDIPVLKVVGGASPAELCQRALENLPQEFLANLGKSGVESSKPIAKKPEPKVPTPKQEDDSESSSSRTPSEYNMNTSSFATPLSSAGSSTPIEGDLKSAMRPDLELRGRLSMTPIESI